MAARQIELSLISPSWLALRVSAVKALCEGRMEEVRRVIEQAGGLLASELPYYRFERTLLANLRAKIA